MAKSEDTEATANSEDSEVMERWEDLVDTDWDTENPYMEERASIIGEMMISVSWYCKTICVQLKHCGHTTTAIWVSSPTPVLQYRQKWELSNMSASRLHRLVNNLCNVLPKRS